MASLYYSPSSCAVASYIAAVKAGLLGTKVHAYEVNLIAHLVKSGPNAGEDYYTINPKGNVPALVLDDHTLLNECSAVLQWIADQNPASMLAPAPGTSDRYLLQTKLSYVSTELHAKCAVLFNPAISTEVRTHFSHNLLLQLKYLNDTELINQKYIVGDHFTIADSYLYVVLSWLSYIDIDLAPYPHIKTYFDGIAALDFVKEAHADLATAKLTNSLSPFLLGFIPLIRNATGLVRPDILYW
jgi:glutathione S-transferase